MSEAEKYTAKENAKDELLHALKSYIAAAEAAGMNDEEQASDVADIVNDAGKSWCVV